MCFNRAFFELKNTTVSTPKKLRIFWLLLATFLSISGCSEKTDEAATTDAELEQSIIAADPLMTEHTDALWQLGGKLLATSADSAQQLQNAVQGFLKQPDDKSLSEVKQAWQQAHDSYLQFELFTFLGDASPDLFGALTRDNFDIHAWPITPGYIDYFQVYTDSGMVNDIALAISAQEVRNQHGFTDDTDVSIGLHAIEYLLWGEQGKRPAADYIEMNSLSAKQSAASMRVVDLPSNRRRTLLGLLSQLLVDDVNQLQTTWRNNATGPGSVYQELAPLSRVQLWQEGISRYVEALQLRYSQLQTSNNAAVDNEGGAEAFLNSEFHSQFASLAPQSLSTSLSTLQTVFFDDAVGLGLWLFEGKQGGELQTALDGFTVTLQKRVETGNKPPANATDLNTQVQTLFAQMLAALHFEPEEEDILLDEESVDEEPLDLAPATE